MLTFEKLSRHPEIFHRPTSIDIDRFQRNDGKSGEVISEKAQSVLID